MIVTDRMINERKKKVNKFKFFAAVSVAAVTLNMGLAAGCVPVLAATGTVSGSSINVRKEASTSSDKVGTLNSGDTVQVGDSTDADGYTWYAVTLEDGTTGYVVSNYITVSDDASSDSSGSADSSGSSSTESSTETSSESSTGASTENAAAADTTQSSPYQVVNAEDGEWYLYDTDAGERMKISDIKSFPDQLKAAQDAASSEKQKNRILLIVLIAVVIGAVAALLVMYMRSHDEGGRDLKDERERARRSGRRNVDDVNQLRQESRRTSGYSGRSEAYPSGRRGQAPQQYRREDENMRRSSRESAPHYQQQPYQQQDYNNGSARRGQAPQPGQQPMQARPQQNMQRPVQNAGQQQAARPQQPQQQARRPQPKNFAGAPNDDFDYDFIENPKQNQ